MRMKLNEAEARRITMFVRDAFAGCDFTARLPVDGFSDEAADFVEAVNNTIEANRTMLAALNGQLELFGLGGLRVGK